MIDQKTCTMYVQRIIPLIIHPNKWVRDESLRFIQIILDNFPPAHVFLKFHKIFQAFFKEDIILLKSDMVQYVFLDPLSRSDYDKLMDNHLINRHFTFEDRDKSTQKKFQKFSKLYVLKVHKTNSVNDYEVIKLENEKVETKSLN